MQPNQGTSNIPGKIRNWKQEKGRRYSERERETEGKGKSECMRNSHYDWRERKKKERENWSLPSF
jgi:hypothetical protein